MKTAGALLLTAILVLLLVIQQAAAEPVTFTMVEASMRTATVTDIDYNARTVRLAESDGSVRTLQVGDVVRNFNKIKKGDTVTVEVSQAASVEVQPGPGETLNVGSESQTSALPEEKPGGISTIEGTLRTRVESIDYDKHTVTCKNRKSILTTYKIDKDAKRFNEIRRGDMLFVQYKKTTVVSVK